MVGTSSNHTMYLNVMPGLMTGFSALTAGFASINQQIQNITNATTDEFGLMTGLFGTATVLLGQFAKGAIDAFGEFEQGMKIVQVVSNQAGAAMNELKSKSTEFSIQYRTDIDQITEGLQTLGRAGLNSATEQTEVLQSGLQTAKLEGRELNSVLQELIQNTSLLGGDLKSDQFGEQSEYINNLLVSTSMTAPITTHDISETLKYSGGIAAAAGANIESEEGKQILTDYMASIAAFAQKGVTGSIAGTALRAFFNKPATQDSSVVEGLSMVGLTPEDLWQDGGEKMKPISQQIGLIKKQMDELNISTMDQLQIWSKIVGGKMGQQMMKLDSSDIKELTKDIKSASNASDLANASMKTYNASVKEASEAGQAIYRNIGQHFVTTLGPIMAGVSAIMKLLANPYASFGVWVVIVGALVKGVRALLPPIRLFINELRYGYTTLQNQAIVQQNEQVKKQQQKLRDLRAEYGVQLKLNELKLQQTAVEAEIAMMEDEQLMALNQENAKLELQNSVKKQILIASEQNAKLTQEKMLYDNEDYVILQQTLNQLKAEVGMEETLASMKEQQAKLELEKTLNEDKTVQKLKTEIATLKEEEALEREIAKLKSQKAELEERNNSAKMKGLGLGAANKAALAGTLGKIQTNQLERILYTTAAKAPAGGFQKLPKNLYNQLRMVVPEAQIKSVIRAIQEGRLVLTGNEKDWKDLMNAIKQEDDESKKATKSKQAETKTKQSEVKAIDKVIAAMDKLIATLNRLAIAIRKGVGSGTAPTNKYVSSNTTSKNPLFSRKYGGSDTGTKNVMNKNAQKLIKEEEEERKRINAFLKGLHQILSETVRDQKVVDRAIKKQGEMIVNSIVEEILLDEETAAAKGTKVHLIDETNNYLKMMAGLTKEAVFTEEMLADLAKQAEIVEKEILTADKKILAAKNKQAGAEAIRAGTSEGGAATGILGKIGAGAKNVGSSLVSFFMDPVLIALTGITLAIEYISQLIEEEKQEIRDAKEKYEEALSNWQEAEDALESSLKDANSGATNAEIEQKQLDVYSNFNKALDNLSGDVRDLYAQMSESAELPQYQFNEDGTATLIEEEISSEQETQNELNKNTKAVIRATVELNQATDAFISKASSGAFSGLDAHEKWWGRASDNEGPFTQIDQHNKAAGDWKFEGGAGNFRLTDEQQEEDYVGSTELTGIMLENFKDANGNWIYGLRFAMGESVEEFADIIPEASNQLLKDIATSAHTMSAADNLRLQLSMRDQKKDWQALAKEIGKYEAKTQKPILQAEKIENQRLNGYLNKLIAITGGGFSRSEVLQMAYLQQMSDMLSVAKEQIMPVVAENTEIAGQNWAANAGVNENVQGTGSSTYGTYANAAIIAAYVAQMAEAKAAEVGYEKGIKMDPNDPSLSEGERQMATIAHQSANAQDFTKRLYAASSGSVDLWDPVTWGNIWGANDSGLREIAKIYGAATFQTVKGMSPSEAQKAAEEYVDSNPYNAKDIIKTLAKNYTSDGFVKTIMGAYLASDMGEVDADDAGSGAGSDTGSGSGSDSGSDSGGTTKNRVDLVLCNKKEIPKLNVNLFKKEPSFTVLNKNFRVRDIKVNTQDKPKAILSSVKNAIIDVEKRTDPKIIQDEAGEYDPVAATEGNSTPTGKTNTQIDS